MKNRLITNAVGLVQVAIISAMTIGAVGLVARQPSISTAAQPAQAALAIGGNYGGSVALKFTLGGVYSDTLATPTPPPTGALAPKDVGQIDLTLFLSQNGNAVSGYVNLDASLVFSPEHTIQATPVGIIPIGNQPTPAPVALKIGPTVQGTFDGTTLNVLSEKVTAVVGGCVVQRQFSLVGALKPGDANTLVGEYRETIWGYGPQPLTVIGKFSLARLATQQNGSNTGNAAPIANPDSATVRQGVATTLNVLANDTATNGSTLTITSVSKPQHGAASTDGSKVSYTPSSTFAGVDTFNYFVSDGKGGTAVGSVTIKVFGPIFLPMVKR